MWPAVGSWCLSYSFKGANAVVINKVFKFSPPNAQDVTVEVGKVILSIHFFWKGSIFATTPPLNKATYNMPC